MSFYVDEEQVWKCPKHPLKHRRTGICPTCLRERLITLCPECANTRPCSCFPTDSTSTSSSSSSSFSLIRYSRSGSRRDGFPTSAGEVDRMSNLIEGEPAFRKSRSLAIPMFRSRSKHAGGGSEKPPAQVSRSKINFWSVFKVGRTNKCDLHDDGSNKSDYLRMMRSRSVAAGAGAGVGAGDGFSPATIKRRGWYFPSPMKAFRHRG